MKEKCHGFSKERYKIAKEIREIPHFFEPVHPSSAPPSCEGINCQMVMELITTGRHFAIYISAFQPVFKIFTVPLYLHVLKNAFTFVLFFTEER